MALPPISLTPSTELDAVNSLLQSIGQSPVNSLVVPGIKDVAIARATLHEVSREVQTIGWWFNTDNDYGLLPDVDGSITLPPNALQVQPNALSISERANKLYDTEKHSFIFPTGVAVKCQVRWFFAFEELPQSARTYITARAGRRFQANIVGSDLLYRFTDAHETECLTEMKRNQERVSRTNWFQTGASTNNIFSRR